MIIGASGSYIVVNANNNFRVGMEKEVKIYIYDLQKVSEKIATHLLSGIGRTVIGNKDAVVVDVQNENCWVLQKFDDVWFLYIGEEGNNPDYNLR